MNIAVSLIGVSNFSILIYSLLTAVSHRSGWMNVLTENDAKVADLVAV